MYYRFHFVGATFGQHEFIRNLQHLSYSTSVTLILRRSSLALRARKAHNSLAQSQNPLAPSYRTRLFLHAIVDNKNWPPLGVDGNVSSVSPSSEGTAYNLAYFC